MPLWHGNGVEVRLTKQIPLKPVQWPHSHPSNYAALAATEAWGKIKDEPQLLVYIFSSWGCRGNDGRIDVKDIVFLEAEPYSYIWYGRNFFRKYFLKMLKRVLFCFQFSGFGTWNLFVKSPLFSFGVFSSFFSVNLCLICTSFFFTLRTFSGLLMCRRALYEGARRKRRTIRRVK